MLQSIGSNDPFVSSEPAIGSDRGSNLNLNYYLEVFKRRFFYFLLPFGLISTLGLYLAAIQKPSYLAEAKILLEAQTIAPDIVRPVITTTSGERVQLIEQRVTTRDTLLSIASKFGLFPQFSQRSLVVDLMRKSVQIKPVESGRGTSAIALTVGFEYDNPELAMRVANEFVTLIVGEDARSRTTRATEGVRILADEAKDIENKLESMQIQILEIARRPRDTIPETSEQQRLELAALAALKGELAQKSAVYSEAHPAVAALKKRVAAMEKTMTQTSKVKMSSQSTQDEMEVLKRQREALQNRLADTNGKLASARISESQEERFESLKVIESPSLPQKPKSSRQKTAGISFVAAIILGIGAALGIDRLDGSIRHRHDLDGVVPTPLIVCIPYITTRTDTIRTRQRVLLGIVGVGLLLAAWGALGTAIVLNYPLDRLSMVGWS